MINIKKFINNVRKQYPQKNLFEESFSSLRNNSDDGRRNRASGMSAFYQGIQQSSDGHAVTTWSVPSQSDPTVNYQSVVEIIVPIKGGLFTVAKSKWDPSKFASVLKSSDVRVSCTCPDFWWGGQTYNLGPKGSQKGNLASQANTTDLAPNVRDPKREHTLCKHLIAVFNVFPFNATKIMSGARKYDANIQTNPQSTKDIKNGKSVLNKEKELFSIPNEGKTVITDALYKGAEELSKNQDNAGAEDIINERNETTVEISSEEINPEVDVMIDERNDAVIELEKDKDDESLVSDDVNELLNRA